MKTKNLFVLATILVVVIGIIVIANQLGNKKPSEQSLVFLPQFTISACTDMVVVEGKDTAKLARRGGRWFVVSSAASALSPLAQPGGPASQTSAASAASADDYPADSSAVQVALEKLKNLKKDDLISQNRQKQAELEVDSAKGIYVEVFNDKAKSMGAVYIGKSGSNWDSHFIREKGSDDVYLSSGSVRFSFFGDKKRWKDKTITKFDKSFVKSLQIAKKDSAAIELVKIAPNPKDSSVKEGWEITKPEKVKAKKDKVEEMINTFSNFMAADFETDKSITADSMGFTKPSLVLSATLQNGESKTIIIGKKKGTSSQYWAKNPENTKAMFLIDEYKFNNCSQGLGALKDVPEVKKEPEKTGPAKTTPVKTAPAKPSTAKAKEKKEKAKTK